MPKISVIMSVFNGEKFLKPAIESVLNQQYTDFEFIITNDGSFDSSGAILDFYAQKDKRIKVVHQANIGLTNSLNKLVDLAQSNIIARMDADDLSSPQRFGIQYERMAVDKNLALLGCWCQTIDENNKPFFETFYPDSHKKIYRLLHAGDNCFMHGSIMMRKNVLKQNKFKFRFKYGQDYDLWLRISENNAIGIVEKYLFQRREHSATISCKVQGLRVAMKSAMLKLSKERLIFGKEISNWEEIEQQILNDRHLWETDKIAAYQIYLNAYKMLAKGKCKAAESELLKIEGVFNEYNTKIKKLKYLCKLPGKVVWGLLSFRDQINNFKSYKKFLK